MSNKLKVSITGGEEQGRVVELDLFTSLLVGRSRKADIRLHEADVSGRHFEFVRGTSGCCVKDLSRNGLKVDGHNVGEGEIVPVRPGSVIEAGADVKLTVEEMPEVVQDEARTSASTDGIDEPQTSGAEDFFGNTEADRTESAALSAGSSVVASSDVAEVGAAGDTATHGDFEDALTDAGEGETQEMKTRVGSMEEIYARKLQLDRASIVRRWKFGSVIVIVMLILAGVWFYTGSRHHVSDAEGPFLPNGEQDIAMWDVCNAVGDLELSLEYPRDDRMKVTVSGDSNIVDVVSFLGIDRDVPFHAEFKRWNDSSDLQNSLEDSFEKRIRADSEAGMTFEMREGRRPQGEFFDTVFPGYCERRSQRGVRFVRTEFTRSMKHELWHGVSLYLRSGETIYQLRTEIPDVYWKRGGYRLTGEPHLSIAKAFSDNQWDSPGRAGLVSEKFSDDYLLQCVKRELSAERVASWPVVATYIDTLLVRSWGEKPVMQKLAMAHYRTFLDRLERFYNERHLAFRIADANGDEKRMKTIFTDVKTVFGPMTRDRRSSLVYNPGVWTCHQGR